MFVPWPVTVGVEGEQEDERREWKLKHLEVPFLRYPRRGEGYTSMLEVPDNQAAIQEIVVKNPLFKEKKWWDKWLDRLHPERVVERNRRLEEDRRILLTRWHQEAQQRVRDRQAQALVQNQTVELVEQNLGQWIRNIEADERARMESPTERRTREMRQEIQDHRQFLERYGRFRGIIGEVIRSPDGSERQEVFRSGVIGVEDCGLAGVGGA
jgi:hypothetical protein